MVLKNSLLSVLVFFSFLGFSSSAIAAESANSGKKLLFERFMQVTGAQEQYNKMMEIMTSQLKIKFNASLRQLERKMQNATPEQRDRFASIGEDAAERFKTRVEDGILKEMPFSELVDRVYYPVYEKHFDESELRSIIAFYETPAGRKFATVMPNLMQESVSLIKELYGQKLQDLGKSIMRDELQRIVAEMEKAEKN